MDARWFKGHKDKDIRTKELLSYRNAFDDLKEILDKELRKKPCRDYDEPGWAHRQIAVNEYNQMLEDIIKLITLEK